MKKIVLAAAAIAAFTFGAKAQTTATSVLATSAVLVEVIELTPAINFANPGWNTFNTIAEYDSGLDLLEFPAVAPGPAPAGEFEFTLASSVGYTVVATSPEEFSCSCNPQTYPLMASSLSFTVVTAPAGATDVASGAALVWDAGTTLFNHPTGHTYANWAMDVFLDPGYGHQGGVYTLPVTITATTL